MALRHSLLATLGDSEATPAPASVASLSCPVPYKLAESLRRLALNATRLHLSKHLEACGDEGSLAALQTYVQKLLEVGVSCELLGASVDGSCSRVTVMARACAEEVLHTEACSKTASNNDEDVDALAKWFVEQAKRCLCSALAASSDAGGSAAEDSQGAGPVPALSPLVSMLQSAAHLWTSASRSEESAARLAMAGVVRHFRALFTKNSAWRGTNLGGWLLLEPGPAYPLFDTWREKVASLFGDVAGTENLTDPEDEHSLCWVLLHSGGPDLRKAIFREHRSKHVTKETFQRIREVGLNAVRLPFGYWVVTGPSGGDPYEGPCLEVLDEGVRLAGEAGLQVLLDLHGNPGGESSHRPCGHEDGEWRWEQWRQQETLEVLRTVAERYKDVDCVTGLQVCNEPGVEIPITVLCNFYEKAIKVIRDAGMTSSKVAVVIPVFNQGRLETVCDLWYERGNFLKYDNVAFDLHYYHCFSFIWGMLSHDQHRMMNREYARQLASLPGAVVGEWSLARESAGFSEKEMAEFAREQVHGYNHATHGWFFWNWHDHPTCPDWCMQEGVFAKGRLSTPLTADDRKHLLVPKWKEVAEVPQTPGYALWPQLFNWAFWTQYGVFGW